MSSPSPNEDAETTPDLDPFGFPIIPKFSWETQSYCDESFKELPTYSWEFDTCSPIHKEDSTSTIVADRQCLRNIDHIPKFSWEADSCSPPNVGRPKLQDGFSYSKHNYDNQLECPYQKRVVKAVQPYQCTEPSGTYRGSTSNECKDQYYDLIGAQSPEMPNANVDLDVDAIKSLLATEPSGTYGGSTSKECKDQYYDLIGAQSPEMPNTILDLDVDAIKSLLGREF